MHSRHLGWLFTLLLISSFAYAANPKVASTNPVSGASGTQVQILGSGFGASQGTSTVSLGGRTPSVVNWSDTMITVTVPVDAVTGPVYVTVAGTTSNTTIYLNIPAPHINSISPLSGVVGTQVTVSGSGFQAVKGSGSSISFNGIAGTVVSWSDTQIVATVPANAKTGSVSVVVNNVTSNQDVLFTMPNPAITGLVPSSGPVGTSVQINGSGFGTTQGTSTLQFGSTNVTPTAWSDTQITATVPATAISGIVKVTVSGVASTSNVNFTVPPPQVTSVSPSIGIGGTQITVTGSGFQATKGSSTLTVNGSTATTTAWSDTQITATMASSPTTGPVKVTVNGVSSNGDVLFTVPKPVVTSVSPTSGPEGAQIQIAGTGFGATQGSSSLTLGGRTAPVVSWSDTLIVATVPLAGASGGIQVTVSAISSPANVQFTVALPHINSASPASGGPGTQVTISGSNFGATQTQGMTNGTHSSINFNNQSGSVVSWSDTQIVTTVPSLATTGPVTVSGFAGLSNADVVFSMPNPIISSLSPSSAPVGTQVQINGSGFGATQGSSVVKFNSNVTASIVSWSDSQIVATVPSTAISGSVAVTAGGVSSNTNINFTVPPPQIASISPASGLGGTQVTLSGSGFQNTKGSSSVTLTSGGGAWTVVSWSDTQIVATIPSGATTGDVQVTVNGGTSNRDLLFTLPNPVISSVSPTGGPVGAQVQTIGSGFGASQGSSTITLNFVNMPVVSWSDTLITASIPSGATSNWIRVTVGGVVTSMALNVANLYINSFSPPAGPAGTTVTLTGNGFGATQGSSSVMYNNVAITPSSWSDTQIVVNVPSGASTASFSVRVGSTTATALTAFAVKSVVVNSVTPASAPIGAQVQIIGSGFGATQGGNSVVIGQHTATVVSWSNTLITATVPVAATLNGAVVVVGGVQSNNMPFTVLYSTVTSLSPSIGPVGSQITVYGSDFGATQGSSTLNFTGGTASIVSWSDTVITATVPSGAYSGGVYTTVGGIKSNTNTNFTVPPPKITVVSPLSGVIGTQVTVTGSGFLATRSSSNISFNGINAAVVSWSDTQIVANIPTGAKTGPVRVLLFNSIGSNTDVLFSLPNPVVTSLSPASGPMNTQVQINGSGFGATQGSSTLTFFNYNSAQSNVVATPTSWSDTSITALVPANASSGLVAVSVGGVASSSTISFTVPPPQVASVSPNRGVAGTQVTITGSGFHATQGSGAVKYGNGNVFSSIVSWSDTQIVATIGVNGSTGGLIVVQNSPSNSDMLFSFINPVITSLSPTSGPVGTQVQINGSGFGTTQGNSTVSFFNGIGSIVSWSDTQIVATVPTSNSSGPVTVWVGGVTSNSNVNFTVPTPRITAISPASGTVGTNVTITGSGFQAATGSGWVSFNGTSAGTPVSWSDTQIVVAVPAGASSGAVKVTANSGQVSNQEFVFTTPNPVVTGITPAVGPGNTQVQVNGTGFGSSQGASTITIGSAAAPVVSWSDTQIVATVPMTVGNSAPVQVIEGGVACNANVYFTVPAPTIASLSPTIGGVGNSVTITGTGFQPTQSSGSQVIISGGGATIQSWSNTQIIAIVPPSATTGSVRVNVNNGPSNYVTYTVPSLAISSLSPTTGPVGTQVTLTGVDFGATQGTSVLTFNDKPAASIVSWSNTQIVATVPATAATGPAIVKVNNTNSNATYVFTVPPPSVISFTPTGGIAGTQVTINGSGFQASQRDSTITFNGIAATATSWSDTQIVANVPAGAATGPVVVTVNSVPSSDRSFEVPNPVITSISRPQAPAHGTVTITGSGFGPNQWIPNGGSVTYVGSVDLNGVGAGVVSWSDTSITVQLPSNATSGPLTVTKYNATSNGVPITIEGDPTVTGLAPSTGPINSSVVISGSGFGDTQLDGTVQFSGINATVTAWSDTQITAVVPPGDYTGPVNVTVAAVTGPTQNFTVSTGAQLTDALGHSSTYTSIMVGGTWVGSDSQGSGCSSCTVRGTIHNEYDSLGNLTATTDELLHTTNFAYDANQNLSATTAHLDASTPVTTSYTYNGFGEPLTVTDPLGNVATNTYDTNGNLLTVTTPAPAAGVAASVTQFAYDSKGQITQITDPLNHVTTLAYYPSGLIHTITDAQNNITSYEYDLRGNRTAVVDALQNRTTFTYDAGNRLTGITYPDTTSVSFAYDSRGRRTSATDQNGKVTSYAYDDADRLVSVTDAAQHVTHYAYDLENNLLSITDAAQHTTSFVYDAFGRVTQTAFPSSLTENYVYDAVGNLTSKVDRKNQTILYLYDALNRLSHKGYPDATGVDYVYDLVGKIKQVTDPTGTYGFAYDNMGRLIGTTTQYSFLPGITYTNAYGYDAASNRASFTAPDGSTNTYAYDTLDRLTTLTNSLTGQFGFSYDSLNRRTALNRPNGVNTTYGYDSLSRLLNVLHRVGTVTLDGAGYTYDNAGNRTAKTNYLNNITENYTYDPLYQLTQVTQGTTTTESYSYDAVGNRLSSLGMSPYAYNSSNELTSTPSAIYAYDGNGNTVTKADASGTTTYNWNFENRLTSVVLPGSGGTVTFRYDPLGRRIQKSSSNATINYLYDGANGIQEVDVSGALLAHYTQGVGIDEPLAEQRSGTPGYYEQDGLRSVTSLSNFTAKLINSYAYDSFGNIRDSTNALTNPFKYTGREHESETGLQYYRARYYDSSIGRFLSEDPMGFKAGFNFYDYVGNDPIRYGDPLGLLRDCDQEHIECFRKCWSQCPPWPIDRGKRGHYLYCQSKCLAQYMECEAANAAEKAKDTAKKINNMRIPVIDPVADWLRERLDELWHEIKRGPQPMPGWGPGIVPVPPPIPAFPY
jgi:RHS repeat-associated protein